jgi:dihydropyrimidine dehydrogenase (NAD+) subunit PreT
MVYRGAAADMSAYEHEMLHGKADGVKVATDRVPLSVVRGESEKVCGLRVARAENKLPVPGTEEVLPADLIVLAVGQNRATAIARAFPGVELDGRGRVVVDAKTGRTGNPRVWSGGDCVNGGKEVVNAVAEARVAAQSIHAFLAGA